MEYPSFDKPKAGAFRFNTDSSQLEIYDGNQWTGVLATSPEQQTGGTRGMTAAGSEPGAADHIDYWNIATTGNAADFGDITDTGTRSSGGACSNATRALYGGGANPSVLNTIDYLTIATLGNTVDFGDLTSARYHMGVFSSSTRGVWLGGRDPDLSNTIDYVQIPSTGNAVDWGDMYDQIALFATTSNGHGGLG